VSPQKRLDSGHRCHERASKVGKGRGPDDHQQCYAMADNSVAFVRLVANASVAGERDPTPPADFLQPDFVGCIRRKVIGVTLYRKAAGSENLGKLLTEIAIGEIDNAQAARS
jgi:hypothetical protein